MLFPSWLWIIFALLAVNIVGYVLPHHPPHAVLPYTVFRQQVESGNVSAISTVGVHVSGTLRHPLSWPPADKEPKSYTAFTTVLPPFPDPSLWPMLLRSKITVTSTAPGNSLVMTLIISFLPMLLLLVLLVYLGRRMSRGQGGGLFGFGKSRARLHTKSESTVTFGDVAGEDEAKNSLQDIVDFLRDPRPFLALGAQIPKGVLLVGPPGGGNTLLARAGAGEAGFAFYSATATEFVEMFVGVGAARIRDLFQQARASRSAIVFLDELDAVGRRRVAAALPGNEEREQTLNQLLGEMDGFEPTKGVVVLAATNRPDVLDPALLRPRRFDRQVTVGLPDRAGRESILRIHTRQIPLAPDADLGMIARETVGFSGADLANLVNEAAIVAAHRRGTHVSMTDFDSAQDRIVMGGLTGMIMDDDERRVVAYHETGHALAALLSPKADPVRKVSIVPRGRAPGATQQMALADHHNYSLTQLFTRLVVLLAGRAAEELVFQESTTGAEDDLRQATALARQMVTRWGMSSQVGLLALAEPRTPATPRGGGREYSEATAGQIDRETARLISDAHARAADLFRVHRAALDRIANALMKDEVLEPPALAALLGEPAEAPAAAAEPEPAAGGLAATGCRRP
jgi:cell division protease FtsH